MPRRVTKPSPGEQVDKFRDLARDLECDEDEARFEERFKKVATAPRIPTKAAPDK